MDSLLAAVFPVHPFDLIYNHGIRHLRGTGPFPRRGAPARFACGMGAAWQLWAGFGVYVDDPTFTNSDEYWEPPRWNPPSTVGPGDNHENAGDCDGSQHQISFGVQPGTILHLDNLDTECLENIVPNNVRTWSTLKALYR